MATLAPERWRDIQALLSTLLEASPETLGISSGTVSRDQRSAEAWLGYAMSK